MVVLEFKVFKGRPLDPKEGSTATNRLAHHTRDTECTFVFGLCVFGGALILLAPFLSCFCGHGDTVLSTTPNGSVDLARCLGTGSDSYSRIIDTAVGSGCFGVGSGIFYATYTLYVGRFNRFLEDCNDVGGLVVLMWVEFVGAVAIPIVPVGTHRELHSVFVFLWWGAGAVGAILQCLYARRCLCEDGCCRGASIVAGLKDTNNIIFLTTLRAAGTLIGVVPNFVFGILYWQGVVLWGPLFRTTEYFGVTLHVLVGTLLVLEWTKLAPFAHL